ncbi:MAG: hypothetical protein HYR76_12495 [Ignavibacteria bacterium]|nr:hypothetical protein [Ignavibacteria bacterium]
MLSQIENVPVNNQVYEFLDRMGVKGILPLYSNTMIPISRHHVGELLQRVDSQKDRLTSAEIQYLEKFEQEFMHDIDPSRENAVGLFNGSSPEDFFSDREKYLYWHSDSSVSLYTEFIGTLEYRAISGDSYGSTHASFEQHGARARGTIKNKLAYFLQATNGTLSGDKSFALSDSRLRGNVKFNNLNSPYFDFTEGYLRADLDWFNFQFGREYTLVGTGYSDRLLLSENAPAFDFLKIDAAYKSFRFVFLHASLLGDSTVAPGIRVVEPSGSNKYLALHRIQFSAFDILNVGISEMIIYQRFTPEVAYLNPINFYKSSEHSLRDRDNAFLNFDLELFPIPKYKFYGMWLIDDIDVSKMGTGWWGNEFGWQGGASLAEVAGVSDLDVVVEYTRIEPYVYSNRLNGNDYTHNNIGLGHHLDPNSEEWFVQSRYRPMKQLRTWLTYTRSRHGENIVNNGQLVRNVGGSALQGHRDVDSDVAPFLDGDIAKRNALQFRFAFEPINNLFLVGTYELRDETRDSPSSNNRDSYFSLQMKMEY